MSSPVAVTPIVSACTVPLVSVALLGFILSILSVLLLPIIPTLFVLDIYTAFIVQLLFIVNAPLYIVPLVAVGSLPSVVYLIVNPFLVSIVTCLFFVHVSLFAIVTFGAAANISTVIFPVSLYSPAPSYTLTYTSFVVPEVSSVITAVPFSSVAFFSPFT